MSILPHAIQHPFATALRFLGEHLLPGSCLLCGVDCQAALFCSACLADLPAHDGPQCLQCAEPNSHGNVCSDCRKNSPHYDQVIAHFRYEFPVDRIIHALKYGHQLAIARWLGEALLTHPAIDGHDCIIAMPLHPERIRERGFNQSIEIARTISRTTKQPLLLDILKRSRPTVPQTRLSPKERQSNVRGAFECSEDLTGRSILLIDDVMTTGASLGECARILKLHGARRVSVAVAARAVKHD